MVFAEPILGDLLKLTAVECVPLFGFLFESAQRLLKLFESLDRFVGKCLPESIADNGADKFGNDVRLFAGRKLIDTEIAFGVFFQFLDVHIRIVLVEIVLAGNADDIAGFYIQIVTDFKISVFQSENKIIQIDMNSSQSVLLFE